MSNIIEIKDLTKDYEKGLWRKKKIRALDGLSLKVGEGQIFGFLGGNGAGKTTTIKLLMGLIFPTYGSARILGCEISEVNVHQEVGYCPENPYFYDYLTPLELLDYFGRLFGLPADLRYERSDKLLTAVGIGEKERKRQLRKFSKGMLQRVGLAQSLINDPKVVFLDEPMSGLDPIGRREVRELIAGLRDNGKTVFMSTHILSDVEALCDEVAILRKGKLAATGNLEDLLYESDGKTQFELIASGIDEVGMNALDEAFVDAEIVKRPTGVSVLIENEYEIDEVIKRVHTLGGRLVSVNATKQSLEDLFVTETNREK